MKIYIEEVEGSKYLDVILSKHEIYDLLEHEMITSETIYDKDRLYVGVYLEERQYYDEAE